jgi:hypothetical protein
MPPHRDSLGGPVVSAARQTFATGEVDAILPYVPAEGDDEVRHADPHGEHQHG